MDYNRTPVVYATASTYPIFAPYKVTADTRPHEQVGKIPRLMSYATVTLITQGAYCYDQTTRTLRLQDEWRILAERLKILTGGASHRLIRDLLESYVLEPYPTKDGDIYIAESADTQDDLPLSSRTVTFTEDYVNLIKRSRLCPIPVNAVGGSVFDLDLLTICALYTPVDKRLVIPPASLAELMPGSAAKRTDDRYETAVTRINARQSLYRLDMDGDNLVSVQKDTDTDTPGVVLRVY